MLRTVFIKRENVVSFRGGLCPFASFRDHPLLPPDWAPGSIEARCLLYCKCADEVVTLAVYIYLLSSVVGRRSLQSGFIGDFDLLPLLTFTEFFFYMGWLKVQRSILYFK